MFWPWRAICISFNILIKDTMKTKFTLGTTIITLVVVILVLAALTLMDNNTTRNTYACIVMLGCLFAFAFSMSLRQSPPQNN